MGRSLIKDLKIEFKEGVELEPSGVQRRLDEAYDVLFEEAWDLLMAKSEVIPRRPVYGDYGEERSVARLD